MRPDDPEQMDIAEITDLRERMKRAREEIEALDDEELDQLTDRCIGLADELGL